MLRRAARALLVRRGSACCAVTGGRAAPLVDDARLTSSRPPAFIRAAGSASRSANGSPSVSASLGPGALRTVRQWRLPRDMGERALTDSMEPRMQVAYSETLGQFLVSDWFSDSIAVYDDQGQLSDAVAFRAPGPHQMLVDDKGDTLLVACSRSPELRRFSLKGQRLSGVRLPAAMRGARGLCADSVKGTLYVSHNDLLVCIKQSGELVGSYQSELLQVGGCLGFDHVQRELFVFDHATNKLLVLSAELQLQRVLSVFDTVVKEESGVFLLDEPGRSLIMVHSSTDKLVFTDMQTGDSVRNVHVNDNNDVLLNPSGIAYAPRLKVLCVTHTEPNKAALLSGENA